jgi:hypothetical protein
MSAHKFDKLAGLRRITQTAKKPMSYAEFVTEMETANAENRPANFRNRKLRGFPAGYSVLNGADFTGADIRGVDFYKSLLEDAKFNNAKIRHADFTKTWLDNSDFTGSNIRNSVFYRAKPLQMKGNEHILFLGDDVNDDASWNTVPKWYEYLTGDNPIPGIKYDKLYEK